VNRTERPEKLFALPPFFFLPFTFSLALAAAPACGQGFPAKQIRVVVPLAAGGNLDLSTRAILQPMGESLGQRILVENRPGTSSLVGTQYVAKSAPDGYTLLGMANTFATVPLFVPNAGYDPLKDFTGISMHTVVAQLLVVNPSLPARTVKELVALAKKRPGDLTFASSGAGGIGYTAAVQFNSMAGVNMLHVPYKGNSQAILDVMGGQVMMMFDQVSTSTPLIQAGKLRALGVSTRARTPLWPDVPTIDEAGVPGYESFTFNGLVAPAGTPREALVRLHEEVVKAGRSAELRKIALKRGVDLTVSASPEAFTAYIRAEHEKMGKLMRAAGIKPE
jgi:tripartite-type tricarboxylate transporter receptor subunit TctC